MPNSPKNPRNHHNHESRVRSTINGFAIASLVIAIGGILVSIIFWPVISQIASIICGHIARSQIRSSRGDQTGSNLALTGLIISYAFLGASFLISIGLAVWLDSLGVL